MRLMMTRRLLTALALLLLPALAQAQTYTISPPPFLTAFDNSGRIINGACVWTYVAGTTTPVTTYSASTGTTNSNPIQADSAGRFTAFLAPGSSYKFVYESACTPPAHGSVLRTADNINATPSSSAGVDVSPATAGESITAGQAVYLSDGSGGKSQGQWYKADSANTYSATTSVVGIATVNIASGANGTVRIAGEVTGLSALTIPSDYFVGSSGALTATAPGHRRYLGKADSATSLLLQSNPAPGPTFQPASLGCGIRLTLTSGVPVTTADVTGATTVYATPYSNGGWGAGVCAFYDGTAAWTTLPFTETAIPLGTLTSGLPYDVFCYDNSGTMACELLAWTNGSTRATALVLQNGILSKTGALTRRYIGSFYTDSTTTTSDAGAGSASSGRHLYNYYNRMPRSLTRTETTASWNYTTATVRCANTAGACANEVQVMQGYDASLDLTLEGVSAINATGSAEVSVGIGEDSTTTYAAGIHGSTNSAATYFAFSGLRLAKIPAVGHHVYSWNEWSQAAGTTTWTGAYASAGSSISSGLSGFTWQ